MNLYEALDFIERAGLIVEMTEEQRAARRARAKARREAAKGKPVNSGNWAVIAGSFYATPDFFREHKPEGTSDSVLEFVKQNYGIRKSAKLLGFYPTRKKAKEVAISVMNKFLDMCDTAYGLTYNCPTTAVVEFTPDNKRWCSAIRGPGDAGYIYDADKEISELITKMRYDKIHEIEAAEKEAERKKERDREWANNRRNPDHPLYFNVFKHH